MTQSSSRGLRPPTADDADAAPADLIRAQIDAELVRYVVRQAPLGFAIGTFTWVPDVLVSDIAMPGEGGYVLMRKIRARQAGAGGRVLAVALTSYGGNEARSQALSAGFQIHIGKPVEPDQLVGIVASVVKQRAEAPH